MRPDRIDSLNEPRDTPFTEGFSFRKFLAYAGPGWLISTAYLDPGNLESDLQAGVVAGYDLIWVLFWATLAGFVLQVLAARLGVATGRDLARLCKEEYDGPASYALWIMTEIAIIGSDIQEVVGTAFALYLLFGWPLWVGVLVTGTDTITFLFLERLGVRKLEAFFGSLIFTMAIVFLVVAIMAHPSMAETVAGLALPRVPNRAVIQAVGMLGAVVMPHAVYLHSSLVQSRNVKRSRRKNVEEAMHYFMLEAGFSLLLSFFINTAVVIVFAHAFYHPSDDAICPLPDNPNFRCLDIGLSEAGAALEFQLHDTARYLWAIGLLAAGQSSTMTGTYAGQFVMQGFLNLKIAPWKRTFITRSIAIVPAVIVALAAQSSFDTVDEWLNVLQSVQLPFALVPLLKMTNSPERMGPHANPRWLRITGWALTTIVLVTNFYLVGSQLAATGGSTGGKIALFVGVGIVAIVYFAFIVYIIRKPIGSEHDVGPNTHLVGSPVDDDDGDAVLHQRLKSSEEVMEDMRETVPWWELVQRDAGMPPM